MITEADFFKQRQAIAALLAEVEDPEIPQLSIVDLGMVIDIRESNGDWTIDLAPTYSGCPAIDVIPLLVKARLDAAGLPAMRIDMALSPPWSTDWISEQGMRKLEEAGIAPPSARTSGTPTDDKPRSCPWCGSANTLLVSRHGSTPCKASYKCADCLEPFEYFKCY
jgi:ring-1,2-phenylacetyl-CoA epoxidase subunit PaaD